MSKPKLAVIVDGNLAAAGPGDKNNIDGLGTAATRDVGTTSGNVMQVGAFGLGGNMAPGSDTDPNPTGFYYNIANAQAHGSGAFFLDVKYAAGNYAAFRLSTDVYSNNIYWQRGLGGGSYGLGTPVMLIHTGNILSTTGQSTKFPMTQKAVTDALNTKADTSSLGAAATRDVATNAQALAGTAGVLPDAAGVHASFKQYGYGGPSPYNKTLNCNDLQLGSRNSWDGITESVAVSLNLPALGGNSSSARAWVVECFGRLTTRIVQEATEVFGVGTVKGRTFIRVNHDDTWHPWIEIQTTGNILSTTGQSTQYPMTQKAVTDAIANAVALPPSATYEYDALGRVNKITTPSGNTLIGYDTNGRAETITYPTGRVETYAYDSSGNVVSMTATGG